MSCRRSWNVSVPNSRRERRSDICGTGYSRLSCIFRNHVLPLSLLVVMVWQGIRRMGRKSWSNSANFLFGLRILPFAFSAMVTLFFTFPSFWLMERTSLDEDTGTFILAVVFVAYPGCWLVPGAVAEARTTRAVDSMVVWATSIGAMRFTPELSASDGAPALILVGIRRPRVMVSDMATIVLSDDEQLAGPARARAHALMG